MILDEAIEALPPVRGTFWRGVDVAGMPEELRQRWKDAHRKGRIVQYNGYTSVMGVEGRQYPGDWQMMFFVESARDIRDFSVSDEPELVLPRGVKFNYMGFVKEYPGYRVLREVGMKKDMKKNRQFDISEDLVQEFVADGWSREAAIDVLQKGKQAIKQWEEDRKKPIDPKRLEAQKAIFRRMQNEIVAGYEKN